VGAALGALLGILMAAGLDARLSVLAWVIVAVGLVAPSAGLTAIATLAVFREPAGVGGLGFNATLIGACALGALGRLTLDGLARRTIAIRPEFAGIGTFLGLTTFQFLSIVGRYANDRERYARMQLTDVSVALLLIILVAVVFSAQSRRYLVAAMIPGALLAAVAALASLNPALLAALPIAGLLPAEDLSARGTGIFSNPNYLGYAMALAFLLLARGRQLNLPGVNGRGSWVLATPVVLAVIVSFSRGALVALVGGIVALYTGRGRRVFVAAAAVGGVVALVGYPVIVGLRHALIFGSNVAASGPAQAASDASRLAVHSAGLQLFLRHPIQGIGVGQFHYESPQYLPGSAVTFPHDTYLQIAVEQGLLGIGAYVLMLVALGVGLSRMRDDYAVTARAMLLLFAIASLFAEPWTSPQSSVLLWVTIGAALVRPAPNEAPESAPFAVGTPGLSPRRDRWFPRQDRL
jgi:O-antigen ligase